MRRGTLTRCGCLSFEAFSPQVTGLSVTSGVDQMVALHTSNQDDILMCLQRGQLCPNQDRVGELVGTLVDHFTRLVPLELPLVPVVSVEQLAPDAGCDDDDVPK